MFVLFDFDGVIADSFQAAFEVNKLIRPSITEDSYRKRFLGNINESDDEDNVLIDRRPQIDFFTELKPRLMKSAIFAGMEDAVSAIATTNTLIIISSTTTELISAYLEMRGMRHLFNEILGNEVHTDKTEKIKMVFERYGVTAEQCVFVTDTVGDIREAAKIGRAHV